MLESNQIRLREDAIRVVNVYEARTLEDLQRNRETRRELGLPWFAGAQPMTPVTIHLPDDIAAQYQSDESDTPGKAGGLMSGAASKAVGPSYGHF